MKKALFTTLLLFIIFQIKLNAQVFNSESDVIKYMDGKAFYNDQKGITIGYGEIGSLNTYGIIVVANNGNKFYYINCNIDALGNSATIYGMDPNNGNNFGFKLKNRELIVGDDYNGKVIFYQDPAKTDKFGLSLKRKQSTSQSNSYSSNSEITGVASTPVKDVDGNTYKTIKIGSQIWMAENLRTTKYNDGSPIPLIVDDKKWSNSNAPRMCWYNNDKTFSLSNNLGALYNGYAVFSKNNGNKKVCPTGWHIPTDEDWATLVNNLGGYVVAGGKLKATSGWDPPNTGATNSSGFSSTSGGYRNTIGEFNLIGTTGYWWSSTEYNPNFAWISKLHSYIDKVTREYDDKEKGFSVRCLRD